MVVRLIIFGSTWSGTRSVRYFCDSNICYTSSALRYSQVVWIVNAIHNWEGKTHSGINSSCKLASLSKRQEWQNKHKKVARGDTKTGRSTFQLRILNIESWCEMFRDLSKEQIEECKIWKYLYNDTDFSDFVNGRYQCNSNQQNNGIHLPSQLYYKKRWWQYENKKWLKTTTAAVSLEIWVKCDSR